MIRFLQKKGRAQKWLLTGGLLLMSVSMVWYLVPTGNTGFGSGQSNTLATVADHEITVTDLQQMAQQMSNKGIGARLQISESYVKALMQSLFKKTGVRTRGQLVRVALEHYQDQL